MIDSKRLFRRWIDAIRPACLLCLFSLAICARAAQKTTEAAPREEVKNFIAWLSAHADARTLLPHSHVGDARFLNWTLTYDAAVTVMAWTAAGRPDKAQKIVDFYIAHPTVWRLGGIIEGINPAGAALGEDASVRTGSNLWMGLAAIHLYPVTWLEKDLKLAKRLGDFALMLQDTGTGSPTVGGVPLGPAGGPNVVGDQHVDRDAGRPAFTEVFATEHNIDAYALFDLLFQETKEEKYRQGRLSILRWLKTVAYNPREHRFNRGFGRGLDMAIATDVHSWGVSALGVEGLDAIEPGLAEKFIAFVEIHCLVESEFQKPDGTRVTVRGVDFVDRKMAADLGRQPMVSPEWTFQLINAYRRLESDFTRRGDTRRAAAYRQKREHLTASILTLAIPTKSGWGYPYATQGNALIGHGARTPAAGTLSTIGVAYAILALTGFDPLSDIIRHKPHE